MILRRVLIVIGRDRAQAVARLRAALARCEVDGVATTAPLHAELASDPGFARGGADTGYLTRFLARWAGTAVRAGVTDKSVFSAERRRRRRREDEGRRDAGAGRG